jgi:hypothetical protein
MAAKIIEGLDNRADLLVVSDATSDRLADAS